MIGIVIRKEKDRREEKMNNSIKKCQYCKKPLERVKCPSFFEVEGIILSNIVSFLCSFKKKKKSLICNNKDCIGYLDGCLFKGGEKYMYEYKFF